MSIKLFHLFFIVVCTLFSFAVGVWSIVNHGNTADNAVLVSGILFLILGCVLAVYGVFFFNKWKKTGFFS